MAVKSSGALSFATDIVGEFSDSTPHSLSEFYKGGGKVPDAAGNGNVPTSGAISMGDFYGAVNRIALSLTIASNQNNYNIFSNKGASYVAGVTDVTLTINSGATVGSTSTAAVALDTGTGWASGDTITIINNGSVKGRGGDGGNGGSVTNNVSAIITSQTGGTNGGSGGTAFKSQFATSITNNGTFAGGGGGGGGGGSFFYLDVNIKLGNTFHGSSGAGGSGGAGVNGGSGGTGGTAGNYSMSYGTIVTQSGTASNGNSGTATAGGAGVDGYSNGAGSTRGNTSITAGGAGGGLGSAGSDGVPTTSGPVGTSTKAAGGDGGAAGKYAEGNSNITWSTTGTRLGGVS